MFSDCAARFLLDLVGNPEDRFSQNEAHIKVGCKGVYITRTVSMMCSYSLGALALGQCYSSVEKRIYRKSYILLYNINVITYISYLIDFELKYITRGPMVL